MEVTWSVSVFHLTQCPTEHSVPTMIRKIKGKRNKKRTAAQSECFCVCEGVCASFSQYLMCFVFFLSKQELWGINRTEGTPTSITAVLYSNA